MKRETFRSTTQGRYLLLRQEKSILRERIEELETDREERLSLQLPDSSGVGSLTMYRRTTKL